MVKFVKRGKETQTILRLGGGSYHVLRTFGSSSPLMTPPPPKDPLVTSQLSLVVSNIVLLGNRHRTQSFCSSIHSYSSELPVFSLERVAHFHLADTFPSKTTTSHSDSASLLGPPHRECRALPDWRQSAADLVTGACTVARRYRTRRGNAGCADKNGIHAQTAPVYPSRLSSDSGGVFIIFPV